VKLTTHFDLVPSLRMSGAVPLHALHAYITRTEDIYIYFCVLQIMVLGDLLFNL